MKYLATVNLQTRLAPLPSSISLLPKHETVLGVLGTETCDLSRLRGEPIHKRFANWRSGSDDIVEFTRRYGLLDWEGEFASPIAVPGLKFAFLADLWRERQTEFRKLWETARTEGPEGSTWLTLPVAGNYPVAAEADRFAGYNDKMNEGGLIWQTPMTLWEPTRAGPVAQVEAHTAWQHLCLLLAFERLDNLRKCENSDCAAPYFIARRKDQMFCGEDCAHRIAVRRWWRRKGNEWRKSRR